MRLVDAIEALRQELEHPGTTPVELVKEAQKLAIAALHRQEIRRSLFREKGYLPLFGETDD